MRTNQKTVAFWVFMAVLMVVAYQFYQERQLTNIPNFNNSKFETFLQQKKIDPGTIVLDRSNNTVRGRVKAEYVKAEGGSDFYTETDIARAAEKAEEAGYSVDYKSSSEGGLFTSILVNWLPVVLVVVFFMFLVRQMQMGGGKAMSFGKSRARLLTENKNKVTFKDVAGVEEAKEELQEIVHFLRDPKKYTRLGGRIPKGVLLVGPPGTGKTLLARAVAGEAGVPFFTISGSDFVEMFVGVGASRVRDMFEQGKRHAPCLIFIDEIDAVGRHRGAGMGGGHDEREQTLNQLLVEMDGFESSEGVIMIAATNRPDVLDPALLRPGRFDRRVIVNTPDKEGRVHILKVHSKKLPLSSDVDLEAIAKGTPGFSGADLENLVNESALIAARRDQSKVTMADFEHAKDKVMMGAERKSMVISEEEKRLTAYHEAGHAIVGRMMPKTDPVHKVTIIPRGMALGLTQFLPKDDQRSFTKQQAESFITMAFGGRVAEEMIFKDFTTGASNDIERATEIARRMVCEWGMSEKLGPLAYDKREGPVFLGMQYNNNQGTQYSDERKQQIDDEVHRIVMTAYDKAKEILTANENSMHIMAQALLEFETIDGEEVEGIMKGLTLEDLRNKRNTKKAATVAEQEFGHEELRAKEKAEKEALEKAKKSESMGGAGPVTV